MKANNIRRLTACIVDWYLSSVLASIPVLFLDLGAGKEWETAMITGGLAIVLCSGYYLVVPMILNGQTLGKRLMKIRICGTDGSAVTLNHLFMREMAGVFLIEGSIVASSSYLRELIQLCSGVSLLVPLSIVSGIVTIVSAGMAVVRKDGRMLHDWIGKTMVIAA